MKFRFKALERRRQPDQLDSRMVLVASHHYVALWVVLFTAIFVGLWGILGRVPQTQPVSGVLGSPDGVLPIQTTQAGVVKNVLVNIADEVRVGQPMATVQTADHGVATIASSVSGRVVGIDSWAGAVVRPGDNLISVEGRTAHLEAQLLVPAERVPYVQAGQEVTLVVPGVSPRTFGRLKGTVVSVGTYPLSSQEVAKLTGVAGDASRSNNRSGPHQVTVRLEPDPHTPSGYAWTSLAGPPITLQSRTPVDGQIELGAIPPIDVLTGG